MSIWSTPVIRGIDCGSHCKECGEVITDNPDGEEAICEDCAEESSVIA
nr:hypothetical protein BdHM001_18230 [Bdellovibrio sp. HM001]